MAPMLLLLLAAVMVAGCSPAAPKQGQQPFKVQEGTLLPVEERPAVIPFEGKDLYSGEAVSFSADSQDRVRMLSFFSPG